MKSKRSSSEQLGLPFRSTSGLPFAVSHRRIARAARRAFLDYPRADESWIDLRRYVEDVAVLAELRKRYREQLRAWRKATGVGSAARYAGTPEGRRAHQAMEVWIARIAAEHTALCG